MPTDILGKNVLATMSNHGGVDMLHSECEQIVAYHNDSYLPLLWEYFVPKRKTLSRLARILNLQTASQDKSLIDALYIVLNNTTSGEYFEDKEVDISFAPTKWQKLISKYDGQRIIISRRYLEMAVFSCLSNELRSGDIFIDGAETYTDYRKELLDWKLCKSLLNEYCNEVGIPNNAKDFVKILRDNFIQVADCVDTQFPDLAEFIIDDKWESHFKKALAKVP